MCRFLLAKSKKPFNPQPLMQAFADMAKNSKALDGDWQGDGWGMSWLTTGKSWETYHSLHPIWTDCSRLAPGKTTQLIIHARSASFPSQKGIVAYNQPFVDGTYNFVFNGLLKGVSFPSPIPGEIGAQKIWHILRTYLKELPPDKALEHTISDAKKHTRQIQALNIGLSDGVSGFAYTLFDQHPEYYQLQSGVVQDIHVVVSEPLPGYPFHPIPNDTVITF